ncbi:MAG: hypothetical protein LBN95_03695 [Prevotellaceae bacterium]|jgi:hypothetical protein|nr:hypothetical protein [Prevotellaceae bacterium]
MAEFTVSGRMSVATLKKNFKEEFGATLRVYNGAKFADEKATLVSLRKGDAQKGSADFKASGNMQVGTFEQKFLDVFGIKVRISEKDDRWTLLKTDTLSQVMQYSKGETK